MSVCDGSNNEVDVKQEPMDSDKVKSEWFQPGLKSEDPHNSSEDVLTEAQLQRVTGSGKPYLFYLFYLLGDNACYFFWCPA